MGTFQSTRPRGARRILPGSLSLMASFNPRARVGRDMSGPCLTRRVGSFNPRARVGRDVNMVYTIE